jgi:hypothetical protein
MEASPLFPPSVVDDDIWNGTLDTWLDDLWHQITDTARWPRSPVAATCLVYFLCTPFCKKAMGAWCANGISVPFGVVRMAAVRGNYSVSTTSSTATTSQQATFKTPVHLHPDETCENSPTIYFMLSPRLNMVNTWWCNPCRSRIVQASCVLDKVLRQIFTTSANLLLVHNLYATVPTAGQLIWHDKPIAAPDSVLPDVINTYIHTVPDTVN